MQPKVKRFKYPRKLNIEVQWQVCENYKTKQERSPFYENAQQFPYHPGVKWQEDIQPVKFKKNKFPKNVVD